MIMKHNWEYKRLGDVCKLSAGGDKPKDMSAVCSDDYQIPIYSNGIENEGLYGFCKNAKIMAPAVTISGRGTLGVPFIRTVPFVPIIRLIVAIPQDDISIDYLYYWIYNRKFSGNGAAIPQLTVPMIKDEPLPVPPMETQVQIVAELDQINDLIAKNRELLTHLDSLAQSLFYETFGDPISNPKGWNTKEFANVIKLKSGDSLSAKNIVAGIYPVYGGNGIVGYHNNTNLKGENIIIGRVGALCGNVRLVKGEIFVTDNAFITECKEKFNLLFLQRLLDILNLRQYANAAAQPVISNTSLKKIIVPVPPLALQEDFAAKVEAIEAQKAKVEAEIAELQTLLDARMDYWFND